MGYNTSECGVFPHVESRKRVYISKRVFDEDSKIVLSRNSNTKDRETGQSYIILVSSTACMQSIIVAFVDWTSLPFKVIVAVSKSI